MQPLYASWLAPIVGELADEPLATCSSCVMTRPVEPLEPEGLRFRRETKCCTFMPDLPNFAVGGVLSERDIAVEAVRARIQRGSAVTPYGVGRFLSYRRLYGHAESFGRTNMLKCPYFQSDTGYCGVWRHRESICATWFCRHDQGLARAQFWQRVKQWLGLMELNLSRWAAREQGIAEEALEAIGDRSRPEAAWGLDREEDPAFYAGIWGAWAGREEEFFTRCAQAVAALSPEAAVDQAGPKARLLAIDLAREQEKLLRAPLPDLVQIRTLRERGRDENTVRLEVYSPFDWIDLGVVEAAALEALDGKPMAEATAALGEATVRRLVDCAVLAGREE